MSIVFNSLYLTTLIIISINKFLRYEPSGIGSGYMKRGKVSETFGVITVDFLPALHRLS